MVLFATAAIQCAYNIIHDLSDWQSCQLFTTVTHTISQWRHKMCLQLSLTSY